MNIYFAQFNLEMAEGSTVEFLHLPYSTGTIWAYANADDRIKEAYSLKEMFIRKTDIDELVKELDDPAVFGFSTYVWNHNYNMILAKKVKERFPKCKIVFGGPSITIDDPSFMKENTFVDYAVYLEGEISFRNVLLHILGEDVELLGVATRTSGPMGVPQRMEDLDSIPSPYAAGYFDHVIEKLKGPNVRFNAVVETNRGCPFRCTFCDWGSATNTKIKKFDCRVEEDLLWCAQNNIDLVHIADANFGAFLKRDMDIAKYFIELHEQYGAPRQFNTTWHKHMTQEHVKIAELLVKAGLIRKYGVSFQTLSEAALKAIKRKNITLDVFDEILLMAKNNNVPVTVDLMYPLPGQTKQMFLDEVEFMIEKNVVFNLSPTSVLPGAEMNDSTYREKWQLKTRMHNMATTHRYVWETEEMLVGTSDVTEKDFISAYATFLMIQELHGYGFTDLVSTYFKNKFGIKVTDLHEKLYQYLQKETSYSSIWITQWAKTLKDGSVPCGGVDNLPMLEDIGSKNRKLFFEDLHNFCVSELPHIDDLDDLLELQYNTQNYLNEETTKKIVCKSNLFDYLKNKTKQNKLPTEYNIVFTKYKKNINSVSAHLLNGRFSRIWQNKIHRLQTQNSV